MTDTSEDTTLPLDLEAPEEEPAPAKPHTIVDESELYANVVQPAPAKPHTIIDEIGLYANVVNDLRRTFQMKPGESIHLITTVMNYHLTLRQMAMQEQQQAMYRMPAPTTEETNDDQGE